MTSSSAEQKIRAWLPVTRFFQAYIPFRLANWLMKFSLDRVGLPEGVIREAVSADGVPCVWLIPQNSPEDRALLYLHGGGFVYKLSPLHIEMAAYLAQTMGVRALVIDYRVAPEHSFPAALDDCVTAYCWLLKQGIPAQNLALAGDSAGGNLTLTTLMKLRNRGIPPPAAAACLSPVADLSAKRDRPEDSSDPLLPPKAIRTYNSAYIGQNDACNPLISPVFGDWRGLPPLLVHAGEEEILREDAVRVEGLARAAGVEVQLEIYPRMWHVWQLYLSLPQARQSLDEIARFLNSKTGVRGDGGLRGA